MQAEASGGDGEDGGEGCCAVGTMSAARLSCSRYASKKETSPIPPPSPVSLLITALQAVYILSCKHRIIFKMSKIRDVNMGDAGGEAALFEAIPRLCQNKIYISCTQSITTH